MQLLVLALMLLMSGKNDNIKQLAPILESFGGGEAANAIKQAEELSGMLSAVQALTAKYSGKQPQDDCRAANDCSPHGNINRASCGNDGGKDCGQGYPLAPIAGIADERITYCLSRYIALGE